MVYCTPDVCRVAPRQDSPPPTERGIIVAARSGTHPKRSAKRPVRLTEEQRIEQELKRARERRLAQRGVLETEFTKSGVSYTGHGNTSQLEGPARRAYDVLSTLYVAAIRANDALALELALDDAPGILAHMTVAIERDSVWTRVPISPEAYQYAVRFFERGIGWAQWRQREARRQVASAA